MNEKMSACAFQIMDEKPFKCIVLGFRTKTRGREAIDWLIRHAANKSVTLKDLLTALCLYDSLSEAWCREESSVMTFINNYGWSAKMLLPWCWKKCDVSNNSCYFFKHDWEDDIYYINLPYPRRIRK